MTERNKPREFWISERLDLLDGILTEKPKYFVKEYIHAREVTSSDSEVFDRVLKVLRENYIKGGKGMADFLQSKKDEILLGSAD